MHRRGVGKFDVVLHIGRRQTDDGAPSVLAEVVSSEEPAHDKGTIVVLTDDSIDLSVHDGMAGLVTDALIVAAGLNEVADACLSAAFSELDPRFRHSAKAHEFVSPTRSPLRR